MREGLKADFQIARRTPCYGVAVVYGYTGDHGRPKKRQRDTLTVLMLKYVPFNGFLYSMRTLLSSFDANE